MSKFKCVTEDNVAIVTMDSDENRFNYDFFNEFHQLLDDIEKKQEISSLVVTSSHEKIWSNGIDLEWLAKNMEKEGEIFFKKFGKELYRLFIRILNFPMTTFAALNGHAFAGGGIMACAFDYRYMRDDRGWLCFPEVDVRIPFTPFLNAIALKAIPMFKLNQMQISAERLTAQECKDYHIVKEVCTLEDLVPKAVEKAKELNKDRGMLKTMKEMLFADITKIYEESIKEANV